MEPDWRTEDGTIELWCRDCREVWPWLDRVSAVVTDPPYGIRFMGRRWDYLVPSVEEWEMSLAAMKPGAHLLAFAATRTQHRMAVNIEDAGFEIRDLIAWVYGQGFPKSRNVRKAIEEAGGDGQSWEGLGTALKPAMEPVTVARKPLSGSVAVNVLAHKTGALNIDGTRVECQSEEDKAGATPQGICTSKSGALAGKVQRDVGRTGFTRPEQKGRWPANLIHDGSEEVVELFPESKDGVAVQRNRDGGVHNEVFGAYRKPPGEDVGYGGAGSAARFFYCAKASRAERGKGNNYPTVKPIALMRYLVRLVTPLEGLVVDPYLGTGTTGIAAIQEGFRFVGIERDRGAFEIAVKRIAKAGSR